MNREPISMCTKFGLWLLAGTLGLAAPAAGTARTNVLFIAVDDLRPQLGSYGLSWMRTPHIDRLAATGVRFDRHYVPQAVCIPSRVSAFTSLSSERTQQVYGPMRWQRVSGAEPLGKAFSARGYRTVSLGKIWHTTGEPHGDAFDREWQARGALYALPENEHFNAPRKSAKPPTPSRRPPITECAEVPDEAYRDGQVAVKAVEALRELKQDGRPFMLAVGFSKPHLPFNAPKKYWDLYDAATIPLADHPDLPRAMPELAYNHNPNFEMYDYGAFAPLSPEKFARMPDATARHLVHAYAAATSYADACVGRVLDELDRLGLAENTVVVLWGDHGFFLGDLNQWSKHSNFERAARSALIIRAPGYASGRASEALVGSVDLLPTMLDLAALPPLSVSDGQSLKPLLSDPGAPWAEAVWHCFPRGQYIGFAVRTRQARYVEWREGWTLDAPLHAREFYPLAEAGFVDELSNEAENPAFAEAIAHHAELLRRNPGWRAY